MFERVSRRSVVSTGAAVVASALVAGCGSGGSSTSTQVRTGGLLNAFNNNGSGSNQTASNGSASVTGQATGARACPVPQSGTCLGKLTTGQYASRTFQPKLTFRVANGWANYADISGLYLLQPPGAQPPGNSIVGSFVGLETSVAPEAFDCRSRVSGVRTTPSAIAAWMTKQPSLVISHRHAVALGGLHGVVLDVRMAPGAKGCLSLGATIPAAPLLTGNGPSGFDHEVPPGNAERHYLLGYKGGTLDIGVIDTTGGKHIASYNTIVKTFRFAP
jgi:hypothetical protein